MFEIGDVVKLKSGGPWMTVMTINNADYVTAAWFQDPEYRSDSFHVAMLQKAK